MANRQSLAYPKHLERVRPILPADRPIYLVGGAIRDALLGRQSYDLDFVLRGDALRIARQVADALEGAYYPLDDEHSTGRVLLWEPDGTRLLLDFAALRGPDLESDLRARDFTVNAIAADLSAPQALIDPLGGIADLHKRRLRACAPDAFIADPLRVLRGVRLATAYKLRIVSDTQERMRSAAADLNRVSPERQRDELFRLLDGPKPAAALRTLDFLSILGEVLPEIPELKGISQPPPHISDAWTHTLRSLRALETLLGVLGPQHDPEAASDLTLSTMVLRLGRYRAQISEHLRTPLNPNRSLRALLFMAALYHDVGKPRTHQVDEAGRTRFIQHERIGAEMVAERALQLRLSKPETQRLNTIVRHHLRPLLLAQTGKPPTRRAIYRFFRDTGPAGVDICLLSLADVLSTYGHTLPQDTWVAHLDIVRDLLEAWWERRNERVSPTPLLNGNDLKAAFDLPTGPRLGRLLEFLTEAQASGQIRTRQQALDAANRWLAGTR